MYSSNITRVSDGYDCWGRREFTDAYEIKHNGKSIIKIKDDPDELINYLNKYENGLERLANEYISKCQQCDDCFVEFYCIEHGIKENRIPDYKPSLNPLGNENYSGTQNRKNRASKPLGPGSNPGTPAKIK